MCFVFTLRQRCSHLLTAQWPMFASTAAWRHLRCCEFSSTSLKSKTARTILPSTSCTQVAVSAAHSLSHSHFGLPGQSAFQITWWLLWWPVFFFFPERVKLKRSDFPLVLRVIQGPCEQVCKVFLMEEDLGEEVTYDVIHHTLLSLSIYMSEITSGFIVKDASSVENVAELFACRSLNFLAIFPPFH